MNHTDKDEYGTVPPIATLWENGRCMVCERWVVVNVITQPDGSKLSICLNCQ